MPAGHSATQLAPLRKLPALHVSQVVAPLQLAQVMGQSTFRTLLLLAQTPLLSYLPVGHAARHDPLSSLLAAEQVRQFAAESQVAHDESQASR